LGVGARVHAARSSVLLRALRPTIARPLTASLQRRLTTTVSAGDDLREHLAAAAAAIGVDVATAKHELDAASKSEITKLATASLSLDNESELDRLAAEDVTQFAMDPHEDETVDNWWYYMWLVFIPCSTGLVFGYYCYREEENHEIAHPFYKPHFPYIKVMYHRMPWLAPDCSFFSPKCWKAWRESQKSGGKPAAPAAAAHH